MSIEQLAEGRQAFRCTTTNADANVQQKKMASAGSINGWLETQPTMTQRGSLALNDFIHIPKRKSLTRNQKAKVFSAAQGRCHLCGQRIHTGEKWEADHITPREISGSDALAEYAPAHLHCHKGKTAEDKKLIAKVKRTQQKHLGLKKRTRKIPYRKFNGEPVWPDDS